MEVVSNSLGLYGVCDNIEFHKDEFGAYIPFLSGKYTICPIEYKNGVKRNEVEYNLQLIGQAVCLEDMFNCIIEKGYIYYSGSRERFEVNIAKQSKDKLKSLISEMRIYMNNPVYVEPLYKKRCPKCAVYEICSPKKLMISTYMKNIWKKAGMDYD